MVATDSEAPLVSVVVPFFNSERHLAECVESLLSQENVGGPYEVILINNLSSDESASIVERYPELIVLEQPTPGSYAARNAGIRQARSPLIAFTDADCVAAKDWLRSILDGMEDPSVAILLGCCLYPAEASFGLRLLGAYENSKTRYVTERCPSVHHYAHANNMAVRASLFVDSGLFKEWQRAADTELVHRLAARHPDFRLRYNLSMKVTHMEFLQTRDRLRRMSLYTQTNSKIDTFRELGPRHRIGVLRQLLKDRRSYW